MGFLQEYSKLVRYSGMKVEPTILLIFGLLVSLAGLLISILMGDLLYFVIAFVVADIVAMAPYYIGKRKSDEIEENLSDALRQMSAVLRSGGTFEVAVREISLSEYGQLSREFSRMLREMEGGKQFTAALESLALRVHSPILERVVIILGDAIKTGGRVSDILDEIAEDVRLFYQVRRDRRVRTTMQFFFILASAAILGPFLVGIAVGISKFMINLGSAVAPAAIVQEKAQMIGFMGSIMGMFVVVESILAAFMGAAMRDGEIAKGIVYAPMFLLMAYLSFIAGKVVVTLLV